MSYLSLQYPQTVACSSWGLFKNSDTSSKALTAIDFLMQVQPNWMLYLLYTSVRCSYLGYQYYQSAPSERYKIWQQAQVYASTKTVGLLVSQLVLSIMALTTPASVALILTWGAVLFSMSMYAYYKANAATDAAPMDNESALLM